MMTGISHVRFIKMPLWHFCEMRGGVQPAARTRLRGTLAHLQAEKSFPDVHAAGKTDLNLFFALRGEKSEGLRPL